MNLILFISALLLPLFSFAGEDTDAVARFQKAGYRCSDTPDRQGSYCTNGTTHAVIPKDVEHFTHTVFYAHGLVGVCGNGASGERYLKYEAPTLRELRAVAVMPWRSSAGDASFPLSSYMAGIDRILGEARPLYLAGHSAAGSFFATTLNGTGSSLVPRVDKILLLDAIYGDQASRWLRVLGRNGSVRIKILSSTTAARARALAAQLQQRYSRNVSLDIVSGDHCSIPAKYFRALGNF